MKDTKFTSSAWSEDPENGEKKEKKKKKKRQKMIRKRQ